MKVDKIDIIQESKIQEGPISWLKNKFSSKDADTRALDKYEKELDKIQTKKAPEIIAKDFDSSNARSTFYKNHDYKHPYDQRDWINWFKSSQSSIDSISDENRKLDLLKTFQAERYNAIVVDEHGYFVRRGAENLRYKYLTFVPGENDKISNGYFIEPYNYNKNKSNNTSSSVDTKIKQKDIDKFIDLCKISSIDIYDAAGKKISVSDLSDINEKNIDNYTVKYAYNKIPVSSWIERAKLKHIFETFTNSEGEKEN